MNAPLAPAARSTYRTFLAIPTRWMDNDTYGHVNNVTYYSYFDTAVNEHLIREGGLDIRGGDAIGIVVETACRFHKPLSFPEIIDAGLAVARVGHSSVAYDIALFRQGDDSHTRRHDGVGLGLSLVRACLSLLRGDCRVTPGAGGGTIVELTIPDLVETMAVAPAAAASDAPPLRARA